MLMAEMEKTTDTWNIWVHLKTTLVWKPLWRGKYKQSKQEIDSDASGKITIDGQTVVCRSVQPWQEISSVGDPFLLSFIEEMALGWFKAEEGSYKWHILFAQFLLDECCRLSDHIAAEDEDPVFFFPQHFKLRGPFFRCEPCYRF